jgi:hypothetical protein
MKTNLPPILETKLADFRKRVWMVKLAEGLLAALFGLAVSYVLVFVLDRFFETSGWVRGLILLSGAAVLGVGLPLKWHRWVWRQKRLEDAARLLRRTFPRLGDQLLGIVELARMETGDAGRSERLVQAAMAQAADAVKDKDFTHAVPQASHRRWGLAAAGVMALVLAAFVIVNEAARNALARWVMPWADIERFTFAKVEKLPEKVVVPYAEPFDMPVKLAADTEWTPESGKGRIGKQPAVEAKLNEGNYPLAFPPQKQDAEMFVKLGDVRKTVEVQPRTRPELSSLAVRLRLPEYLQYKSEPVIEVRGGSVSVLKGAQAAFEAKASREIATAEVNGKKAAVSGEKVATEFSAVQESGETQFTWKDHDGLTPREPLVLKVNAVEDDAPRIAAKRETMEQVVLDTEVVTFDLNSNDDFGVRRVGLEWTGTLTGRDGKTPIRGDKLTAVGDAEKKTMEARATFCAAREGVAPQTLEIRAWAEDYLPGRKRAYSGSFILHVLNATDHALWVTQQMGKWLEVAKETYEREQQLHETNKEIRAMSAADLDRPENRRRVVQQATAENANAARLDSLTQSGKQLAEQATKNPEFDAKRLESWAEMLKSLKDIAKNRMPGVADLLKQSAGAQGKQMAQNAQPPQTPAGEQKPSQQQVQSSQTSPSEAKPAAAQQQGDSKPSAPQLAFGKESENKNQAAAKPVDPNAKPKDPAPSISMKEAGYLKPEEQKPDENAQPKKPGGGGLKLPTVKMAAAAPKNVKPPPPPESAAQEKMEQAVYEQKNLLAEFAKVSDQLSEILGSLEASTFVKRLKKASREQMMLAGSINEKTLDAFGIERSLVMKDGPVADEAPEVEKPKDPFAPAIDPEMTKTVAVPAPEAGQPPFVTTYAPVAAAKSKSESEVVRLIQSDLESYCQRKQVSQFKSVLDQMKKTEIVRALAKVGDQVSRNLSGHSIVGAEYWADTLDRWAEEIVPAAEACDCKGGSADSLPPEIVLKVMQALRDEIRLRDETRELENAKAGLDSPDYAMRARKLGGEQFRIAIVTQSAADEIAQLEDGPKRFGKELQLLTVVKRVMDEAGGILDTPDTGGKAIAAETEAIELLLQAKRPNPKGGGGGGSDPGGGGTAAAASSAALAELGPGSDADTQVETRPVGQSTGRAGREFPEEFKTGLEAYFNKLEEQGGAK